MVPAWSYSVVPTHTPPTNAALSARRSFPYWDKAYETETLGKDSWYLPWWPFPLLSYSRSWRNWESRIYKIATPVTPWARSKEYRSEMRSYAGRNGTTTCEYWPPRKIKELSTVDRYRTCAIATLTHRWRAANSRGSLATRSCRRLFWILACDSWKL